MNVCGMTGLSMNSCIFYYYEDPGKFYVIHHFIAASSTEYGHMATVCVCVGVPQHRMPCVVYRLAMRTTSQTHYSITS